MVGVDDIAIAAYSPPLLTIVAQPFAGMGALAVAHLPRRMAEPAVSPEPVPVESTLVLRSSTGPVRGS